MSEFFDQLGEFSHRAFNSFNIEEKESPWTFGKFTSPPKGVILHYTGSNRSTRSTVKWFMQRKYDAKVSAHFVVDRYWSPHSRYYSRDLPLISKLPAPIIQCVPLDKNAWHATWANSSFYGIEMVNQGYKIDRTPGTIYTAGNHWVPYTIPQTETLFQLIEELNSFTHLSYILGHEHVQWNKFDPGPLFDFDLCRRRLYRLGDTQVTHETPFQAIDRRRDVLSTLGTGFSIKENVDHLKNLVLAESFKGVDIALDILGYPMPSGPETIKIFQMSMKLKPDGIAGPKTCQAIWGRLVTLGYGDASGYQSS